MRCYNLWYMALTVFRKIRKVLEKPVPPAHIRQRNYRVVIPWYQRLWDSIRPPTAAPRGQQGMNTSQRRMLLWAAVAMVPLAAAWLVYDYTSRAPERAAAALAAGMQRMGPGDFSGAVDAFTESISVNATAEAYLQRGNAHASLGQAENAVADWSRAVELDATLAEAYTARGSHFRVQGDLTRALADLDRSIDLRPSVDGFYQRGQVHHAMREYEKALADYDRAIDLRREAPYVYLARSATRRIVGDESGALLDLQAAEQLQGRR